MPTYSTVKKAIARQPERTLVLEPACFADDWSKKPKAAVCVGLKLMCDGDKSKARSEAERLALELHERGGVNAIDAFNDALMRQCAALAICSPNDIDKPSEILGALAEDVVRVAFTSRGARVVFEAVNRFEVETSPLYPEASDEDVTELIGALGAGTVENLDAERQATVRRFLRYALDEMRVSAG